MARSSKSPTATIAKGTAGSSCRCGCWGRVSDDAVRLCCGPRFRQSICCSPGWSTTWRTSRRRRTRCCVARCRPVGGGEPRRAATFDNRPTWDNPGASFDNRPTWDDWSKSK
ncbi:multiple cyclophane-containing RiPP AmcA [Streptomyces sp. NPDC004244]